MRVIRTVLRAAGLFASLASFMALLTTRGPSGEPSALERIPILMDALEARVAAKGRPPVALTSPLPGPPADPRPVAMSPKGEEYARPYEMTPPSEMEGLAPTRLPTGTRTVRVNRGLP